MAPNGGRGQSLSNNTPEHGQQQPVSAGGDTAVARQYTVNYDGPAPTAQSLQSRLPRRFDHVRSLTRGSLPLRTSSAPPTTPTNRPTLSHADVEAAIFSTSVEAPSRAAQDASCVALGLQPGTPLQIIFEEHPYTLYRRSNVNNITRWDHPLNLDPVFWQRARNAFWQPTPPFFQAVEVLRRAMRLRVEARYIREVEHADLEEGHNLLNGDAVQTESQEPAERHVYTQLEDLPQGGAQTPAELQVQPEVGDGAHEQTPTPSSPANVASQVDGADEVDEGYEELAAQSTVADIEPGASSVIDQPLLTNGDHAPGETPLENGNRDPPQEQIHVPNSTPNGAPQSEWADEMVEMYGELAVQDITVDEVRAAALVTDQPLINSNHIPSQPPLVNGDTHPNSEDRVNGIHQANGTHQSNGTHQPNGTLPSEGLWTNRPSLLDLDQNDVPDFRDGENPHLYPRVEIVPPSPPDHSVLEDLLAAGGNGVPRVRLPPLENPTLQDHLRAVESPTPRVRLPPLDDSALQEHLHPVENATPRVQLPPTEVPTLRVDLQARENTGPPIRLPPLPPAPPPSRSSPLSNTGQNGSLPNSELFQSGTDELMMQAVATTLQDRLNGGSLPRNGHEWMENRQPTPPNSSAPFSVARANHSEDNGVQESHFAAHEIILSETHSRPLPEATMEEAGFASASDFVPREAQIDEIRDNVLTPSPSDTPNTEAESLQMVPAPQTKATDAVRPSPADEDECRGRSRQRKQIDSEVVWRDIQPCLPVSSEQRALKRLRKYAGFGKIEDAAGIKGDPLAISRLDEYERHLASQFQGNVVTEPYRLLTSYTLPVSPAFPPNFFVRSMLCVEAQRRERREHLIAAEDNDSEEIVLWKAVNAPILPEEHVPPSLSGQIAFTTEVLREDDSLDTVDDLSKAHAALRGGWSVPPRWRMGSQTERRSMSATPQEIRNKTDLETLLDHPIEGNPREQIEASTTASSSTGPPIEPLSENLRELARARFQRPGERRQGPASSQGESTPSSSRSERSNMGIDEYFEFETRRHGLPPEFERVMRAVYDPHSTQETIVEEVLKLREEVLRRRENANERYASQNAHLPPLPIPSGEERNPVQMPPAPQQPPRLSGGVPPPGWTRPTETYFGTMTPWEVPDDIFVNSGQARRKAQPREAQPREDSVSEATVQSKGSKEEKGQEMADGKKETEA